MEMMESIQSARFHFSTPLLQVLLYKSYTVVVTISTLPARVKVKIAPQIIHLLPFSHVKYFQIEKRFIN